MNSNFEYILQNQPLEIKNFLDTFSNYQTISDMLKTYGYDEILGYISASIAIKAELLEQYFMGPYNGTYRLILQDLIRNVEQYDWLYSRLEDDISRQVFTNLIRYRIIPLKAFLKSACDKKYPQYFDKNIVSCTDNEVFVDCGSFIGDTAEEFIRQFYNYKHIYAYEPAQNNIATCRNNLKKYQNITLRQCGVGEKNVQNDPSYEGTQIISLDKDIQEPITFLKMNIGGCEIPALLGAKYHIKNDFPKLAVCIYHIVNDIWKIPRMIDLIHSDYRLFIRHYESSQNLKTVVYAIPPNQDKKQHPIKSVKRRKRIVSLILVEGLTNALLLKDGGVIPYLFYKNHNCDSYMVGIRGSDFYSNAQYVKGLKMEFLQDKEFRTKAEWIAKEAPNIDCLQLYGCYPGYHPLAALYKKYNPKGKVSLALDANSHWMDRIQWTDPAFSQFMEHCDVISAAGHVMQKHLNEKWPWEINYIPNGFYNFSDKKWIINFEKKENIILTVGRLGTRHKATHVLLEAFAQIEKRIPNWKLHLIGSIDQEFEAYLLQFWSRFPNLRTRIHFLGSITDRDALYAEYQRSKVFALPSVKEGGTPNVIAEALYAGNAIAITKIDEYQDAICHGCCGLASEINDVSGFADILLKLCQTCNLDKMCRYAYAYAQENFDMEKATAKLYYLIFGEETLI